MAGKSELHTAAENGINLTVQSCLRRGDDKNAQDKVLKKKEWGKKAADTL